MDFATLKSRSGTYLVYQHLSGLWTWLNLKTEKFYLKILPGCFKNLFWFTPGYFIFYLFFIQNLSGLVSRLTVAHMPLPKVLLAIGWNWAYVTYHNSFGLMYKFSQHVMGHTFGWIIQNGTILDLSECQSSFTVVWKGFWNLTTGFPW